MYKAPEVAGQASSSSSSSKPVSIHTSFVEAGADDGVDFEEHDDPSVRDFKRMLAGKAPSSASSVSASSSSAAAAAAAAASASNQAAPDLYKDLDDQRTSLEKSVGKRANSSLTVASQILLHPLLANAPMAHVKGSKGDKSNMIVRFNPLGKLLRNVRCKECGEAGHQKGDRECAVGGFDPFKFDGRAGGTRKRGEGRAKVREREDPRGRFEEEAAAAAAKRGGKKRGAAKENEGEEERRGEVLSDSSSGSSRSSSERKSRKSKKNKKSKKLGKKEKEKKEKKKRRLEETALAVLRRHAEEEEESEKGSSEKTGKAAVAPPAGSVLEVLGLDLVTLSMLRPAFAVHNPLGLRYGTGASSNSAFVTFAGPLRAGEVLEACKYGVEGNPSFVRIREEGEDRDLVLEGRELEGGGAGTES